MTLDAQILRKTPVVPAPAWLPIAEFNVDSLSKLAVEKGLGGMTGQYMILSDSVIERHRKARQAIGTGFVSSRSVLFREVARGVNWIFSDDAGNLLNLVRSECR